MKVIDIGVLCSNSAFGGRSGRSIYCPRNMSGLIKGNGIAATYSLRMPFLVTRPWTSVSRVQLFALH